MMRIAAVALLFAVAGETPPSAQNLSRALASFAAADTDRDGRISPDEARSMPVSTSVFAAEDDDKDGFWSRDEFLVFYRHRVIAGGQPVGADLEAEITRLQALKRVRVVEETRKLTTETSARAADAATVCERFECALSDLEKKCADRKATRADFQRLRNLVILNGRATQRPGTDAGQAASQTAMLDALDRIERRASLGPVTRDEFQSLRRSATATTTVPPKTTPAPLVNTPPAPAAPAGPAESRRKPQPPKPQPPPAPRPTPDRPDKDKTERTRP
ncbi:MAG TPA: hypothetical protein VGR31_07015 [Planctomycetota bacterium]|nr:hypothetical protein [Planctomycetota bacterium]